MLLDGQVHFANDGKAGFVQQVIISQDAARNGVLNGHHAGSCFAILCCFHHFAKSSTWPDANFLPEKQAGRYLVKASFKTLYGYNICHAKRKVPAFWPGLLLLNVVCLWLSTKAAPATGKIEAKIKVTVCLVDCHSANEYKNALLNKKYFLPLYMTAKW